MFQYYADPLRYLRYTEGRINFYPIPEQFSDHHFYFKIIDQGFDRGAQVLDLGCGYGRIIKELSQRGFWVDGLDNSEQMVQFAQTYAPKARAVYQGNVCNFSVESQYEVILASYDLINHLPNIQSLESALACVRDHLSHRGALIIDTVYCSLDFLSRIANSYDAVLDSMFVDPHEDETVLVSQARKYLHSAQELVLLKKFQFIQQQKVEHIEMKFRLFFPQELQNTLWLSGYRVEQVFGNFQGNSLSENSSKMILLCYKR